MTLGERIQEQRKGAGLSQEALGEELGVSRQSISKWESDLAVPELDKLIAMSKRFGLSIGTLLGIEEDNGGEELTQRELRALEAIAAKLACAQVGQLDERALAAEQGRRGKRRRGRAVGIALGALAVVFAVAAGGSLFARLSRVEENISGLQGRMGSLEQSVSSSIGEVTRQVAGLLEEQNRFTAEAYTEVTAVNLHENTVTLSARATPKTVQEGAEVCFRLTSNGESVTLPGEGAGSWSVTATCPLSDDIELYMVIQEGEQTRTELLKRWTGLAGQYALRVTAGGQDWKDADLDGLKLVDGRLPWGTKLGAAAMGTLEIGPGMDPCPAFTRIVYAVFVNGELVEQGDLGTECVNRVEKSMFFSVGRWGVADNLELAPGDKLVTAILAEDNYGRRASGLSMAFLVTGEGVLEWDRLPENEDGAWGVEAWVRAGEKTVASRSRLER